MKRFLRWFLIAISVLIAVFVVGGFTISKEWTVARSITIEAPAEKIYEQVSNLRNWQNWSPWTKEKDETQIYTYEGPESGVGSKWLWTSEKMGKGYLEIKKADPNEGIAYELFIDCGIESTIFGDIAFRPLDDKVEVTWTDRGDSGNNLVKRWMSLFVTNMLGKELDAGLSKLKALVETK